MPSKIAILATLIAVPTCMFGQYIPPDMYAEGYKPSIGFWQNQGQVIGTDGNQCEEVRFYTTGAIPQG